MFWKRNEIVFEIGQVVKFKTGVKHQLVEREISDWHGRVIEIHEKSVKLELDSITLNSFDEELIEVYEEREEYPHILLVPIKDLELSEARDDSIEVEVAQDKLIEKLDAKCNIPKYQVEYDKWVRHFQRSDSYKDMEKTYRDNTDFILETFFDYMYNYKGKIPKKWSVNSAKEVLLYYVPTKITADKELFKSYGEVLLKYLIFLGERKYLKTQSLAKYVSKIKNEIYEKSQDSSKWGMAKSFMMKATNAGVNLNDEKSMEDFLKKEQLKSLLGLGTKEEEKSIKQYVDKKQFHGIWQHQKITVKYSDGKLVENIKFKDVKNDLFDGKCKLIKQ